MQKIVFIQMIEDEVDWSFNIMIILITGASHTSKTVLAQKLLENIFDQ